MRLATQMPFSESLPELLASQTDGFSFAYLKELIITALLARATSTDSDADTLLLEACSTLREQMKSIQDTVAINMATDINDSD